MTDDEMYDDEDDDCGLRYPTEEECRQKLQMIIEQNRGTVRATESQRLLDALMVALLEEGEAQLGVAIATVWAGRVAGLHAVLLAVLDATMVDLQGQGLLTQQCRVCGCTDGRACPGGCYWAEFDLCSACMGKGAGDAPAPGPDDRIVPSPMIDEAVLARYDRMAEQFEKRKDVPR